MMAIIQPLPAEVRSHLRSGVTVTCVTQCVEELLLNSLDASATCVAIRLDLSNFRVQVIDNGIGVSHDQLELLATRYATSKCHTVSDLENLCYFGFRGEALASIRESCGILQIVTRETNSSQTYSRIFQKGKPLPITESSMPRPSSGTTITVHNLFENFPVRQKSTNENLELEKIKQRVEGLALLKTNVSISVRNDATGNVILQTHKSANTLSTFAHLFGQTKANMLVEVMGTKGHFTVEGYLGKEAHTKKALQYIYINGRLVLKTRLHKMVSKCMLKSVVFRKKVASSASPDAFPRQASSSSPTKFADKYPVFVLNVKCPLTQYDITFDPSKTLVEFKDWETLLQCTAEIVDIFLKREKLDVSPESSSTIEQKGGQNANIAIRSAISPSNMKDTLSSKVAKKAPVPDPYTTPAQLIAAEEWKKINQDPPTLVNNTVNTVDESFIESQLNENRQVLEDETILKSQSQTALCKGQATTSVFSDAHVANEYAEDKQRKTIENIASSLSRYRAFAVDSNCSDEMKVTPGQDSFKTPKSVSFSEWKAINRAEKGKKEKESKRLSHAKHHHKHHHIREHENKLNKCKMVIGAIPLTKCNKESDQKDDGTDEISSSLSYYRKCTGNDQSSKARPILSSHLNNISVLNSLQKFRSKFGLQQCEGRKASEPKGVAENTVETGRNTRHSLRSSCHPQLSLNLIGVKNNDPLATKEKMPELTNVNTETKEVPSKLKQCNSLLALKETVTNVTAAKINTEAKTVPNLVLQLDVDEYNTHAINVAHLRNIPQPSPFANFNPNTDTSTIKERLSELTTTKFNTESKKVPDYPMPPLVLREPDTHASFVAYSNNKSYPFTNLKHMDTSTVTTTSTTKVNQETTNIPGSLLNPFNENSMHTSAKFPAHSRMHYHNSSSNLKQNKCTATLHTNLETMKVLKTSLQPAIVDDDKTHKSCVVHSRKRPSNDTPEVPTAIKLSKLVKQCVSTVSVGPQEAVTAVLRDNVIVVETKHHSPDHPPQHTSVTHDFRDKSIPANTQIEMMDEDVEALSAYVLQPNLSMAESNTHDPANCSIHFNTQLDSMDGNAEDKPAYAMKPKSSKHDTGLDSLQNCDNIQQKYLSSGHGLVLECDNVSQCCEGGNGLEHKASLQLGEELVVDMHVDSDSVSVDVLKDRKDIDFNSEVDSFKNNENHDSSSESDIPSKIPVQQTTLERTNYEGLDKDQILHADHDLTSTSSPPLAQVFPVSQGFIPRSHCSQSGLSERMDGVNLSQESAVTTKQLSQEVDTPGSHHQAVGGELEIESNSLSQESAGFTPADVSPVFDSCSPAMSEFRQIGKSDQIICVCTANNEQSPSDDSKFIHCDQVVHKSNSFLAVENVLESLDGRENSDSFAPIYNKHVECSSIMSYKKRHNDERFSSSHELWVSPKSVTISQMLMSPSANSSPTYVNDAKSVKPDLFDGIFTQPSSMVEEDAPLHKPDKKPENTMIHESWSDDNLIENLEVLDESLQGVSNKEPMSIKKVAELANKENYVPSISGQDCLRLEDGENRNNFDMYDMSLGSSFNDDVMMVPSDCVMDDMSNQGRSLVAAVETRTGESSVLKKPEEDNTRGQPLVIEFGDTPKTASENINNEVGVKQNREADDWIKTKDLSTEENIYVHKLSGMVLSSDEYTRRFQEARKESAGFGQKHEIDAIISWSTKAIREQQQFDHLPDRVRIDCGAGSAACSSSHSEIDHTGDGEEEEYVKWRDRKQHCGAGSSIDSMFEAFQTDKVSASVGTGTLSTHVRALSATHSCKFTKQMLENVKVIGQLDNKFIACIIRTGKDLGEEMMAVVDQHAAHERVRLEMLTEEAYIDFKMEEGQLRQYELDSPRCLVFTAEEVRVMLAYTEQFARIGIKFSHSKTDRTQVSLHTIPACLVVPEVSEMKRKKEKIYWDTIQTLIKEHVELLLSTKGASSRLPAVIHKVLCSLACHGAIKFGDPLTVSECEALIRDLSRCDLPFQCAHGRPSVMPVLNLHLLKAKLPAETRNKPRLYKLKPSKTSDAKPN